MKNLPLVFNPRDYPNHYLSRHSIRKMRRLHAHMKAVTYRASELLREWDNGIDFRVGECERTLKTQERYLKTGRSKTMNSRHLIKRIKEYGEYQDRCAAIDLIALVDNKATWNWPAYHVIAKAMKQAAKELGVKINWGGDWVNFADGPHFQLSWDKYPIWRARKPRHV